MLNPFDVFLAPEGSECTYPLDDTLPTDDEVAEAIRLVPPHFALTKTTKVLTANAQEITLYCAGMAKIGIAITAMTGTNTVSFYGSQDGISYNPITVGPYPSANPSAAGATTAAATGSWEVPVQNYQFVRAQLTTGAGPVTVVMAASSDGSYQEAFDTPAAATNLSGVLYPSTTSSGGVNTMTIPAATGRQISLSWLEVAMVAPQAHGGAQLRIWDGSVGNGVPLYSCYLAPAAGSVGTTQEINLPKDAAGNRHIEASPGNAMVIQIVNLGSITAVLNGRRSYL